MALQTALIDDGSREFITVGADATGKVVIPDGNLLFAGDMQRSGADLLIVNADAPIFVVPDYFDTATPADLFAPNGAVLRGPMVEVLAGPEAPGQYAQQGPASAGSPIGQVEALNGAASIQRADGSREAMGPETPVFLGDLVETGPDASLSLTFVDGTIFTLSANARMVIDELIYDPEGSENSASFNLIQGGFVFIAGQIAPTGGMDIVTPTATMGIRGTTVLVDISTLGGIVTVEVSLLRDPDGSIGRVQLFDLDGQPIAEIDATDTKWIIAGDGSAPQEVERTAADDASDAVLIAEAVSAFEAANGRVSDGGAFVTFDVLGDMLPPGSDLGPPAGPDTETLDEAPSAPAPPPAAAPPAAPPPQNSRPSRQDNTPAPEDEANRDVPDVPLAPSVRIAGQEDPPSEVGIPGQLNAGTDLAVRFAVVDAPGNGEVELRDDGSFTYTPDENFNGVDQFTYLVTDSAGNSDEGVVTVFVEAVNDAPAAQNETVSVDEDGAVAGTISASDVDGDRLSYALASGPSQGTVVLTETGEFVYRPRADFAGEDQFIVDVSDGAGGTAQSQVTVTVENVNDAPVVVSSQEDATGAVLEDGVVETGGQLVAEDADAGDSLSWSGSAEGAFGVFSIDETTGVWTYTVNSDAVQGLSEGQTVVESFTATVRDASGASADQTVSLTITGTNDLPEVSDVVVVQNQADGSVSGTLTASDVDSDGGLSFSLGDLAPQNGEVTLSPEGAFTYTPNAGFRGVDKFSYVVEDADGGESSAVVSILVNPDDDTPPDERDVNISIDPTGGDPDLPGEIEITRTPVLSTSVNIALAIDWSNNRVEPGDIEDMVASVTQALADMADTYRGSSTQIDVRVIAVSDAGVLNQTFDLQDPALREAISSYDFGSGPAAPLVSIVEPAREFFEAQPLDEQNYLFLVTPGDNVDAFATDNIEALDNPAVNGFDLTIEAFEYGRGAGILFDLLFSPPITPLEGPETLGEALPIEPVFGADLVDLSVGLFADGVDQGEIANEDTVGIIETDEGLRLVLADIPGIADLLGSENILTVEAGFDLDGDASTTELTLFASETLSPETARASTARSVAQFDLEGDLTGALLALAENRPTEVVDMDNGLPNSLTLTGADILGLSDRPDPLIEALVSDPPADLIAIYGDAEDTVTLQDTAAGTFSDSGEKPVEDSDGNTLELYNFSDASGVVATVAVDAEVAVSIATAQAVA